MIPLKEIKIAIVGLGYVGLPLAIEFSSYFPVIGFDIDSDRVHELSEGNDRTLEANLDKLKESLSYSLNKDPKTFSKGLLFSTDLNALKEANVFVVTVPTPIDKYNSPNLGPLLSASKMLGQVIKKGDLIIYESTVYPGCTEEECVPVIERESNLTFNKDFYVGYSPERINPGDKIHTLTTVTKVTSGSTPDVAVFVDNLYKRIILAGTHLAPSIKVAEASKAIENAQRDVNISFVNELALIFDRVGIDTTDVLDAAGTKYNFLKYKPGLVGGHCISVDPYYLAHKATQLGYHPQVILSGRRVNDMVATFIANKVVKLMIQKGYMIKGANVLIMGITFKENCPDVRNTKVVDILQELNSFGLNVDVYDPWADVDEVENVYHISVLKKLDVSKEYNAIIVSVAHDEFKSFDYKRYKASNCIIFDAKSFVDRSLVDGRL